MSLENPFSLKLFKVIASLDRYFILGSISTCIVYLNSNKIFDKTKSGHDAGTFIPHKIVNECSISVTFDLWPNRRG